MHDLGSHDLGSEERDLAASLATAIDNPADRAVFDFLIDHAGERFNGAAIADRLGLPEHTDVGRATYRIGEACAALGIKRPWTEAQQGYTMSPEIAELFRSVRVAIGG
ncbi:MAG: DUF6416 domain-containing protein [Thermomicrobiales bacterium]